MDLLRRSVLAALLCWPAVAGSGDERAAILARFDHADHARALNRGDLGCLNCHDVGAEGTELPPVPEDTCHACHKTDLRPRYGAPEACGTCHEDIEAPDSHGGAWLNWHGTEQDATCDDCHTRRECVDCHERRQQPQYRVHQGEWLAVHGIEAGAGGTCDTCHQRQECTSCHGGTP